MKKHLETIVYYLIVGLFLLIGWMPPKVGFRFGAVLGRLFFLLDQRRRKITMANISLALELPPDETRNLAIRVYENLGRIIYEIGWFQRTKKADLQRYFRIEGLTHLQKAHASGRGILILSAHLGNWELFSMIGDMMGFPLSVIYRPINFKPLDRFFLKLRSRFGARMLGRAKSYQTILTRLSENDMILLMMDQYRRRGKGVWVDFFNHPASTNKGMALLAMKTGALVVPLFLIRDNKGYVGKIFPEVPLIKTGDLEKDLVANTLQYNRVMEDMIRQYPEQWFWIHRRWKHSAERQSQVLD